MSVDALLEQYREENPGTKVMVVLVPIEETAIPDGSDPDEVEQFMDIIGFVADTATRAAAKALVEEGPNGQVLGYSV